MSSDRKSLEDMVKELPPRFRTKVREFVEALEQQNNGGAARTLNQNWAGALSDYREQYTSLDLQKKALEWRGD